MMHGFQQIVTQAERRDNFVVHGLPPLRGEMGVSPLIWRKKLMDSISGNLDYYTEALRLQPSYAGAHYNLGNVLNRQGKMQEAIQQYTEALRLQPTYAEAQHNLGATLADDGHIAEAIEHYTEALRLRPRYVNAHYNLGIALAKQGRLAEAQQHFAEVLRLDPTHTAARRFLERSGQ